MIKRLLCSISLVFCFCVASQNLIPNHDFETFSSCPNGIAQMNKVANWYSTSASVIHGSPDYYNACSFIEVGVPNNFNGFQEANSGNAYTGIVTYIDGLEFREYIGVQLSTTLVSGMHYYLEMYLNLSDLSLYTTDTVGVYFSNTAIENQTSFAPLAFTPQITATNVTIGSTDWVKVVGTYEATGGENYLTIGNFNTDANTHIINLNNGASETNAYIYIDDVSLFTCPVINVALAIEDATNGMNDGSVTITSSGGQESYQYSLDDINFQPENTFTNLAEGDYTVYVNDENGCPSQTSFSVGNVLSTASIQSELTLNIYPNPFKDQIHIDFTNLNTNKVTVTLYDISGKRIQEQQLNTNLKDSATITPAIQKGMYFLQITTDSASKTYTLIKQ